MRFQALFLFLLSFPTLMSSAANPPPAPPTLAWALLTAPPPAHGLLLTVGAERVPLPLGTEMPAADASLADIATAFGQRTDTFGSVSVIAPATKVALNEDPGPPDIFADLNRYEAFKALTASLDDPQWKALTSEIGLGLTDLTDDTQKALFHGLFLQGRLWVASSDPELSKIPDEKRTDIKDVSDQIDGARLRLGQTAKIRLYDKQGETIYFSGSKPDAGGRLRTWSPRHGPLAAEHSILLRAIIPNIPKDGDLRPDSTVLRTAVSWTSAKTVGELVSRISALTHQEIYADPRYAEKTLTLFGSSTPVPAGDLLRALAFAVAGTYRQVGPAFVLTDDVAGAGARRQRLLDWEKIADTASSKIRDEAGQVMMSRRLSSARSLPTLGDPVALTPEQVVSQKEDESMPGIPDFMGMDVPFAKLTSAQQAWCRQIASQYEAQRSTAEDILREPDLKGNVRLSTQYQVQLVIPGVANPVSTGLQNPIAMLYYPGEAALFRQYQTIAAKTPTPPPPTAPHLGAILKVKPRRAVLGHPRTPAEVDALIAAMQKLSLNELWVDIFSGGTAYLPNSRLSSKSISPGTDILAEALTKAQGTGIAVYADMNLLHWDGATPDSARDLTILGETSAELAIHNHERDPEPDFDFNTMKEIPFKIPTLVVSPAATRVRGDLSEIVRLAAGHSGLAGFVWEDAEDDTDLGYTPEMRLAFLRTAHADPLDLAPKSYSRADLSLPTFDDEAVETKLEEQWAEAHPSALVTLLKQMRQSISSQTAALPIFMEQSAVRTHWFSSWDDPKSLPPPLRPSLESHTYQAPEAIAAAARTQGKAVLLHIGVENDGDTDTLARSLKADLDTGKWDGYVLDFKREEVTQGKYPLDSLVQAVNLSLQKHPGNTDTKHERQLR